jgi:hypothetical protein
VVALFLSPGSAARFDGYFFTTTISGLSFAALL